MQNNQKLPPGWAYDPFEETEIIDECPICGYKVDDDTEIFVDEINSEIVGCENCIWSGSANESNEKGLTHFMRYRTNPATGMKEKVRDDD